MGQSEELPLFRDCYNLLNVLIPLVQSFPRLLRHNLGSRMVDLALDIIALIYKANSSYDKLPAIVEMQDKFRMLQMLFRVCVEQRILTERQYAHNALLMDKIGRQMTGWRQFAEKGMKKSAEKKD